jgi:hypothetical protein
VDKVRKELDFGQHKSRTLLSSEIVRKLLQFGRHESRICCLVDNVRKGFLDTIRARYCYPWTRSEKGLQSDIQKQNRLTHERSEKEVLFGHHKSRIFCLVDEVRNR